MVHKTKFAFLSAAFLSAALPAAAAEIETNMAQMQAMDKITGRVSIIEVPVGGEVKFGTFSIVVRACKTRPEGEIPENFAFVDVSDKSFNREELNIFKGWMLSSSPAVNAVEHPIYDVWLLKCINGTPNAENLLSPEELEQRDNLPMRRQIRQQVHEEQPDSREENVNIYIKDSMYKEEPRPQNSTAARQKDDDTSGPLNLLNIREDSESPDEETVILPAEELSEAISREARTLQKSHPQPRQPEEQTPAAVTEKTHGENPGSQPQLPENTHNAIQPAVLPAEDRTDDTLSQNTGQVPPAVIPERPQLSENRQDAAAKAPQPAFLPAYALPAENSADDELVRAIEAELSKYETGANPYTD